jgi:isoleucyl-tRNA synthetase
VELGRQARAHAGIKLRQPLRRVVVYGATLAERHVSEIKEELRVDDVSFETGVTARLRFKPNLRALGPRFGSRLPEIQKALEADRYEVEGVNLVIDGEVLTPDEVLRERLPVTEGWVVAADGELSVELDPSLDPELEVRGRVLDLIHAVNVLRKERGLEVTDRIRLTIPSADADLLEQHAERIKDETLAVQVDANGAALGIEKV